MADCASRFQNITVHPVKQILHAADKNILQNIPIIWEDVGVAEDIYGTSVPHVQVKIIIPKFQHVEPLIVINLPNIILDRYKRVILFCDLIHINGIGFLNTKNWSNMFATGIIIKNW